MNVCSLTFNQLTVSAHWDHWALHVSCSPAQFAKGWDTMLLTAKALMCQGQRSQTNAKIQIKSLVSGPSRVASPFRFCRVWLEPVSCESTATPLVLDENGARNLSDRLLTPVNAICFHNNSVLLLFSSSTDHISVLCSTPSPPSSLPPSRVARVAFLMQRRESLFIEKAFGYRPQASAANTGSVNFDNNTAHIRWAFGSRGARFASDASLYVPPPSIRASMPLFSSLHW